MAAQLYGNANPAVRTISTSHRIRHDAGRPAMKCLSNVQSRPIASQSRRPTPPDGERREPPGTFDLLGFTHFWSRSRYGNWVVKQKTSDSRFSRGLKSISQWCRFSRHETLAAQHHTLCQKLRGHNAYYGITGNSVALSRF